MILFVRMAVVYLHFLIALKLFLNSVNFPAHIFMTYTSANPELNWVARSLSFERFSLKIRDTEKNLLLINNAL